MINIIVASDQKGGIGRDGDLLFHISADLRRFKSLTSGYTVIMGRKTWESLPRRPLPGRRNIVITRDPDYKADGAEVVASPQAAVEACSNEDVFIIGGGQIYSTFLPVADRIYLTRIEQTIPEADTFIGIKPDDWTVESEEGPFSDDSGFTYSFINLRRKPKGKN